MDFGNNYTGWFENMQLHLFQIKSQGKSKNYHRNPFSLTAKYAIYFKRNFIKNCKVPAYNWLWHYKSPCINPQWYNIKKQSGKSFHIIINLFKNWYRDQATVYVIHVVSLNNECNFENCYVGIQLEIDTVLECQAIYFVCLLGTLHKMQLCPTK